MSLLSHAQTFWKAMKDKFRKQCLIRKEQRSFQQDSITQLGFGMLNLVNCSKLSKDTKTKSFLANSITKGTQSLRAQRITLAKFGGILKVLIAKRKNDFIPKCPISDYPLLI